ncbi:hypothetical protein CCH79_00014237, partial [Gambusia affinis]
VFHWEQIQEQTPNPSGGPVTPSDPETVQNPSKRDSERPSQWKGMSEFPSFSSYLHILIMHKPTGMITRPQDTAMPEVKSILREVLPKQGQLYMEDVPTMVLCKPKLLPLKSVTLEKLEKMQMEAQEAVKQQELAMKEQGQQMPS